MVFRKESKADSFQRQMSALRQQLGGEAAEDQSLADQPEARGGGGYSPDASYGASPVSGFSFGGFGTSAPAEAGPADMAGEELPQVPAINEQTSVVAHDTTWKGDLETSGSLHVHGRVEGGIRAQQDVFIAEEAQVDATIDAANVIVAGQVNGTIRCGARFEVLATGRVTGDVQAPALVVREGGNLNAQFRMSTGEQQSNSEPGAPNLVQRRASRGSA